MSSHQLSSRTPPPHPHHSPRNNGSYSSSGGTINSWSLSQHDGSSALGGAGNGLGSSSHGSNGLDGVSAASSRGSKSVVMVKLTDAAIKALEEYVRLANEVRL